MQLSTMSQANIAVKLKKVIILMKEQVIDVWNVEIDLLGYSREGPLDGTLSIVDIGTTPNVPILTLRERVQKRSHAHHGSANIVR